MSLQNKLTIFWIVSGIVWAIAGILGMYVGALIIKLIF